uniref:Protein-glutamine gamma-glutamyltransferase 2 n=1 Tax=Callorhinchus milii TaxID=7868 RepID=A0A4W3IQH0_CALMI
MTAQPGSSSGPGRTDQSLETESNPTQLLLSLQAKALSLQVDLHYEKNNQIHNSLEMSNRQLIVRRGQPFQITIRFEKSRFDPRTTPSAKLGTRITFSPSRTIDRKSWSAVVVSVTQTELSLSISPSPNSIIGRYTLFLQDSRRYQLAEFVLLFNPWCSDDCVHLEDDDLCEEYVMNENGLIYYGDQYWIRDMPWNFGQFDEGILDICFKLLDNSLKYKRNPLKDQSQRNDPVYISRVVSSMVNSNDENGVVQGRWDGNYSSGVSPTRWNGSIKILRQWIQSGFRPVRYGQCWVFAAVACTVLRCLGIPSRVITNFSSAHDTDENMGIDAYFDENGTKLPSSTDSIWNFHVWVESWMLRNDLRSGFDGWQVVDPTPQETSEGIFCCGPSPVIGIKNGQVDLNYDSKFIYAEVNADKVFWMVKGETKTKLRSKSDGIGKKISTKNPRDDTRDDITHLYKYPEGSNEERRSFRTAVRRATHKFEDEDELELTINTVPASNGSNVKVMLVISNKSNRKRVCRLLFAALKKSYSGITSKVFVKKFIKDNIPVEPRKEERTKNRARRKNLIFIVNDVFNGKRKSYFTKKNVFHLQLLDNPIQNKPVSVEMRFENPLPETLTDCVFTLEGGGLIDDEIQIRVGVLKQGESTKAVGKFTPRKAGKRKLIVSFDSNKLKDVKKSIDFKVSPAAN